MAFSPDPLAHFFSQPLSPALALSIAPPGRAPLPRDTPLLRNGQAHIVVVKAPEPEPTGAVYMLYRNPTRIGRGTDVEISLSHTLLSKNHARVELRGFSLFLIDENSRNGTVVFSDDGPDAEGQQVTTMTALWDGALVSLAKVYVLRFGFSSRPSSDALGAEELRRARVDALTNLPSRRQLDDCLERAVLAAKGRGEPLALLLVRAAPLPRSGSENAGPGALLVKLAEAVRPRLGANATLGRFGTNELGAVAPGSPASSLRAAMEGLALEGAIVTYAVSALEVSDDPRSAAEALRTRATEALG